MRYRDIVKFDPIESVVQLRDADEHGEARGLVSSYVISPEMAERLEATVFSQLQFDKPSDNKGVFVVGNYGTGKSHLMSFISATAEHADLAEHISDPETARNAKKIARKFKVVRTEIGAVRMDLRSIFWRQLEDALDGWGVDFRFPATETHASNKPAFEDMMAAFEERYPDKGLLLVVDELLDYLRSGTDQEQILNLNFLREVGEVCKGTRFRFLTGVQEAIFDSPRFQFAADTLLRVKDRFEQFLIARRDVKFVVAERLLKKTADQEAQVRAHLEPFAKFYGKMNERMDEFVRLFPVHPDYIDTFERIFIVEKREVLRSLSQMMRKILDDEVPEDRPGSISYDAYWRSLVGNPAFRSEPSVREVIEVGTKLEERIEAAFPTAHQKALALQLVHGLAVNRLTTGDFHSEMGATAQELRDSLCVYDPMVEGMSDDPADDLAGQIRVILNKARKTVDGTYLGLNAENDQFYLRVTDEPDPDTLIEKRREILDNNYLNRYYFEALKRVMELTDDTVISGRQIRQQEITWLQRNAPRKGYLFFGAPDERPTAQPPRDFYLYFPRPYDAPRFKDEKQPDEVFFRLSGLNEEFSEPLARYAAALDLAGNTSGTSKATFQSKADGYLRELVKWLKQNMATAFEVTYGGKTLPILQWAKGTRGGAAETVREAVQNVASACLAPHFEETAPEYPKFSVRITYDNLEQTAKEALRGIAVPSRSRQANAALDALELLDGDKLEPRRSRYAKKVLSLLEGKGAGQVTNREELVEYTQTGEFFAPDTFRLEPEWLVVVLAALVHSGDLLLALPGKKLGASDLDVLAATPLSALVDFKHVERPKGWDKPALEALFELVGLAPGLAGDVVNGQDQPVGRLLSEASGRVKEIVRARQAVQGGLVFWGRELLSSDEADRIRTNLDATKSFLETLQAYSTPAKLKNLKRSREEIEGYATGMRDLRTVAGLREALSEVGPAADYLSTAMSVLPEGHPLAESIREEGKRATDELASLSSASGRQELLRRLETLKGKYSTEYMKLHTAARLGMKDDERKRRILYDDERLKRLNALSMVELMPVRQLQDFKESLAGLKTCPSLTSTTLKTNPVCQHCGFRPAIEGTKVPARTLVDRADDRLDALETEWSTTLKFNLEDPAAQENLPLLSEPKRRIIEGFLASGELPEPLDGGFVDAVGEALENLEKVVVRAEDVRTALLDGGSPATPEEMMRRFKRFLEKQTGGRSGDRVRIVLE